MVEYKRRYWNLYSLLIQSYRIEGEVFVIRQTYATTKYLKYASCYEHNFFSSGKSKLYFQRKEGRREGSEGKEEIINPDILKSKKKKKSVGRNPLLIETSKCLLQPPGCLIFWRKHRCGVYRTEFGGFS